MRNLLIAAAIGFFSLPAHAWPGSSQSKWPSNWRDIKSPPDKSQWSYVTVNFTNSLEEACREFREAYALAEIFRSKKDAVVKRWLRSGLSEEEWSKKTGPAYRALNPRERKEIATAVEVLRQADYPDWKLYSRYHISGVGDLWRTEVIAKQKTDRYDFKYTWAAPSEAETVCEALF